MTSENDVANELNTIARAIENKVAAADEQLLQAAATLAETRARFKREEFPGQDWKIWSRQTLKLGASRLRELLRIGEAEDPAAELQRQRDANANRQQRYRNGTPANPPGKPAAEVIKPRRVKQAEEPIETEKAPCVPPLRNGADELIAWAHGADEGSIQTVLKFIRDEL